MNSPCTYAVLPEKKYGKFKWGGYGEEGSVDLYPDKLVFYKKSKSTNMLLGSIGSAIQGKGKFDLELTPAELKSVEKRDDKFYVFYLKDGRKGDINISDKAGIKTLAEFMSRVGKDDQLAKEKAEAERLAAEKAEAERIAAEKAEAERITAEKAEAERIAAEKAEAERIAAEKAEAERLAAEKAEAERIAAEKAEAERLAAEKAEAERIAAEKAEAERIAAEKAEAERLAAEKAEAERIAAEKAAAEAHLPQYRMVLCTSCGEETPAGKFCMMCGEPLVRFCTNCGTKLPGKAHFCIMCGKKVR